MIVLHLGQQAAARHHFLALEAARVDHAQHQTAVDGDRVLQEC